MRVLSDATSAAFQLRLEQLAALLEAQLLEERALAAVALPACGGVRGDTDDGQRLDLADAAQPPHCGGAAADLADYDREAALARLSGHVASALESMCEQSASRRRAVLCTVGVVADRYGPESPADSHRRDKCVPLC